MVAYELGSLRVEYLSPAALRLQCCPRAGVLAPRALCAERPVADGGFADGVRGLVRVIRARVISESVDKGRQEKDP